MTYQAGRHFLQVPGPTNIPDRILHAIAQPVLDHRGPAWARLQAEIFERIRPVFKTRQPVMIFPASGSGGWESALVNTLSPGDQVLTFDTGQFAVLWGNMAHKLGLDVQMLATDWRRAPSPEAVEAVLTADKAHKIKAILLVHNETSNGVMSRVAEIRKAIDRAGHPALLMLDTISSLGSADMRMDEWGVDVVVGGSQKGLMLPTGLAFVAASEKARALSKTAKLPRAFWDWEPMLAAAEGKGNLPYTPACNLFFGLKEALDMIDEEGLEAIFARHARRAQRIQPVGDRRVRAGRLLGRRLAQGYPGALQHVARRRARQAGGQGVPYRPSRGLQRPDAGRHAERRGNGSRPRQGAASHRRRAGGAELSVGRRGAPRGGLGPRHQPGDPQDADDRQPEHQDHGKLERPEVVAGRIDRRADQDENQVRPREQQRGGGEPAPHAVPRSDRPDLHADD